MTPGARAFSFMKDKGQFANYSPSTAIKLHTKPTLSRLALMIRDKKLTAFLDEQENNEQEETKMKVIPTRADTDAESIIAKVGLKFTMKTVSYAEIDIAGGVQNLARTTTDLLGKAIDPDVVSRYAGAMQNGDIFPHPVLVSRPGKAYLPAGGNHRLDAWKNAFGSDFSVESYIVDGRDQRAVEMLPRLLNLRHGLPTTHQQALDAGLVAVQEYGYKIVEAEKMCSLRPGALKAHMNIWQTRKDIADEGVNASMLNPTITSTLSPLRSNSHVLGQAAALIIDAKLKSDQAAQLVKDIRKERNELAQLSVVKKYKDELAARSTDAPSRPAKRPLRIAFLMTLSKLEGALKGKTKLSQLQITEATEQKTVSDRIKAIIPILTKLTTSAKRA